jgi:signal transduction histidine kinase
MDRVGSLIADLMPPVPTIPEFLYVIALSVAAAALAWSLISARRAARESARANAANARLQADNAHRATLLELSARALAGGSTDAICRDAVSLTQHALGVDHCCVFELRREEGPLVVLASIGWETGTVEGLTVTTDVDTHAGYALHARTPVVVNDADVHSRFAIPPTLRARGVRSSAAARIAGPKRPFGVLMVSSITPRTYSPEDLQFVAGAAAVLAGMFERKRLEQECAELTVRDDANRAAAELAARRAAFLAQTATVFDTALEPDTTLVSLARLSVPALAECAIVDRVQDDGRVRRVEVVDIDPVRRDVSIALKRQPPDLHSEGPFSRAIRTGQPSLFSQMERDFGTERDRLMESIGCRSLLLIPLVARGLTLGLLTLASRERRYDAADLAVAQELAGRAAAALDNARLYREAQAASRAKDEFLATVSHELRTPINSVLGWAAILRQHRLDQSRVDYACDAIERGARAQARLLEQLLDVSRAISGKLELRLASAEVAGIVEAAVDAVRPDAEEQKVRLSMRVDRTVPAVPVDAQRLEQVVINILSNAVKFSPENSLVQVDMRREDENVVITVKDQGIGIRREFLPYVFERFRQDGGEQGAERGLGLGMSIARDIVERHGGTITAESAGEGQGATFTVRLPLQPVQEMVPAIRH